LTNKIQRNATELFTGHVCYYILVKEENLTIPNGYGTIWSAS